MSVLVFEDALSGAIGSVLCVYIGLPFDTVKIIMQTSEQKTSFQA